MAAGGLRRGMDDDSPELAIDVWDLNTKRISRTITLPMSTGFHGGRVLPDGKTLLVYGPKAVATFFDLATGKRVGVIKGDHEPGRYALSEDGKWLVSVGRKPKTLRVFDVRKRKLAHELYEHLTESSIEDVAISPDGRYVASAETLRVLVFDLKDKGKNVARLSSADLQGSYTFMGRLAFLRDGKTLVVSSSYTPQGRGFVLWDWKAGSVKGALPKPPDIQPFNPPFAAAILKRLLVSPDGQTIVTGGQTGLDKVRISQGVRRWSLKPPPNPEP